MNDASDSIKDNKKIIAVFLIVLVGVISVTAFVTLSQSMNESDPMNNSTDEPMDNPAENTTDDTNEDVTDENNTDGDSDTDNTTDDATDNTTEDTSEQDSTDDSADNTTNGLISTQYVEGTEDELRDVIVSENSTDENPILEVQVGATTQSVVVVDGITNDSTVYSINQDRTRDRFEVEAPQSNGTYSGTYYLWLTDNSGQTSKFQMDINEDNLV